jgi:HK97 gp10 family phage protein
MSFEIIKNGDPLQGADEGTEKATQITVMAITTHAKTLQQPDTGRLRNGIMWKVQNNSGGLNNGPGKSESNEIDVNPVKFDGYVGSATPYAIYVEFGTKYQNAQPYLRPAVFIAQSQKMGIEVKNEHIEAMRKAMGAGKKFVRV